MWTRVTRSTSTKLGNVLKRANSCVNAKGGLL